MCGRFSLTIILSLLEQQTGKKAPEHYKPSYNIAPSQNIVVDTGDELSWMKWGYQPEWAKKGVINAQLEGVFEKPFWKHAKRCVIIADGFYEWKAGTKKIPYRITPDALFAFAAVYDEKTRTVAIVTTAADKVMQPVHHRMPVMLPLDKIQSWIEDGKPKPLASKKLRMYPISDAVNNPRNNSKELLAEV